MPKRAKPLPSAERLNEKFYIADDGLVRRKSTDTVLGSFRKADLRTGYVDGGVYSVKRVAFKMQTGREPVGTVQFVGDRFKEDYRITNLQDNKTPIRYAGGR